LAVTPNVRNTARIDANAKSACLLNTTVLL
jgi:hypothetical protein